MEQEIKAVLKRAEERYDVQILYACETGSRAWGFPSPDSDYDVRFIYRHERDWYLSLSERKDTIEFMNGDLDVTGWDLQKCLKLLKKSNVPLIERFQSPVVSFANEEFRKEFVALIKAYYSQTAAFFHHYSLANKFWEDIKDSEQIKLKSYFYLVRSLLSCNWIVKDKTVLPMHMKGLMRYIGEEEVSLLKELISLKATVGESYLHPKSPAMHRWVAELFHSVEASKDDLGVNNQDYSLLNHFFLKAINESADN